MLANKYGGRCVLCDKWVEPMQGTTHKAKTRWVVMHGTCPDDGDLAAPDDDEEVVVEEEEEVVEDDAPLPAGFDLNAPQQPLNTAEQVAWLQFTMAFKGLAGIVAAAGLDPEVETAQKPQLVEMSLQHLPVEARRTLQQDAALERFTRFLLVLGDSSLTQAIETL